MKKDTSCELKNEEEAVSPVIATILMVAITVVLAGVLYVWASELAGNQVDAGSLNTYSVEGIYSAGDNAESDTLLRMSFTNGPDDLQWSFLTVTLYDESSGQTYKCTPNGEDNCAINEETKDDAWQGNEIITLSENGVDICGESTTCELKVVLQYKGKTIAGQSGVITVNVGTDVADSAPEPEPECTANEDCEMGEVCSSDGETNTCQEQDSSWKVQIGTADMEYSTALFTDSTGTVTLTTDEAKQVRDYVKTADSIKVDYRDLPLDLLNIYANSEIQKGQFLEDPEVSFNNFVDWFKGRMTKEIEKRKSKAGKLKVEESFKKKMAEFNQQKDDIVNIFKVSKLLSQAKQIFINKYNNAVYNTKHFLDAEDGTLKVTSPEGYVSVSKAGDAVKLVDRLEFSRANFSGGQTSTKK